MALGPSHGLAARPGAIVELSWPFLEGLEPQRFQSVACAWVGDQGIFVKAVSRVAAVAPEDFMGAELLFAQIAQSC